MRPVALHIRVPLCVLGSVVGLLLLVGVAHATPTGGTPSITGTAQEGQTLTASAGTWTGTGTISYTYTWQSGGATAQTTGPTAATTDTYNIAATDVGKTIDVQVTATDSTPPSASATSTPTAVVTGNTVPPSITGVAQEGQILTTTQGTWTGGPTLSDQWESCTTTCTPISGATGSTYTVAAGDVAHTIEVVETATYPGPTTATATSLPTATVSAVTNTVLPSISGIAQQGQTLTEVHGTWSTPQTTFAYQWEACTALACSAIPGANGATYVVQAGDVGNAIAVIETVLGTGGPSATSAHSAVVTATSSTSLAILTPADPNTNQLVTLAATVISNSGRGDPSGFVTFFDSSQAISVCSKQPVKASGQSATVVCQTSFPASTAVLSATYQPAAGSLVAGSTSSTPTTLSVGKDATSTSLAVTKKVGVGGRAVYTATVVLPASNSGPVQPTGAIEFLDHGRPISACVGQPLSGLTATCALRYKTRGSHVISAAYNGDANFLGSTSPNGTVKIGPRSTRPTVLGFITSTVAWTFYYHPTYTQVVQLRAYGVISGIGVRLTCSGPGCPFTTVRTSNAARSGSSMNLTPFFRGHHLRPGAQITLRFTHRSWIGKYYLFTIRAGRAPAIDLNCLGVGATRPGVGC